MSCYNSNCYLPRPPRDWSRVQNSCSLVDQTNDDNQEVYVPYLRRTVPQYSLIYWNNMLAKGNVLQYKSNSSCLTKNQKYSKIAKGQWVNDKVTWATQNTRGYTNPNINSLKRYGNVVNVAVNPASGESTGETTLPPTCISYISPVNYKIPLPGIGSSISSPVDPPNVQPSVPSGTNIPAVPSDSPIQPIVIQDFGSLLCNVQENICTGQLISQPADQMYHLTTDSDVPGNIEALYWNDGTQTWYPKQRTQMSNSGNKFPYSSGPLEPAQISAVFILPPTLLSATYSSSTNSVTLTWKPNDRCIPALSFLIYENDILVKSATGTDTSAFVDIYANGSYNYYVVAKNNDRLVSDKSNILNVNV